MYNADSRVNPKMILKEASPRVQSLFDNTVVWDNHACMPLRPGDTEFLPQLERCRLAGITVVFLNVSMDLNPPDCVLTMLATFRHWIAAQPNDYLLVESLDDIVAAKQSGRLAICFDIEGGRAVEPHPGLVEVYYRLGVRWMLIAYNQNNGLGGGCQDDDPGLSDYGRLIIDEMEKVGMVLCCSHTGYTTALQAMEHASKPVIFSHSNPRALHDHPRNIPDELMQACAETGGVVSINGIGDFLGDKDNSTETLLNHIDYTAKLIGPEHVGLGLDYVYDLGELETYIAQHPNSFPPDKGYGSGDFPLVEPERFPAIAQGLFDRGYDDDQVRGIVGHNNWRVAREVWK